MPPFVAAAAFEGPRPAERSLAAVAALAVEMQPKDPVCHFVAVAVER